jgi:NRAMP (natural resistance-associated macrophage protein)-like metal ion transporter
MFAKLRRFFKVLGPGLITGAADDDPSGIATYSLAGAQFGYNLLWTAWLTAPLMIAIQEMCGRIGLVTESGLARVMKTHYPKPLLWLVTSLLVIANIFNIGADLSGMAAALRLLLPIPELFLGFALALLLIILMIRLPYRLIANTFKWLTLTLFAYIITFFIIRPDYAALLKQTFLPDFTLFASPAYLLTLVGVLGTTISPYLFFWQTSEEVEEEGSRHQIVTKNELKNERDDTAIGMLFSNLATYFIIAATGATLFKAGVTNITSAAEAAAALRPLAGDLSFLLFALGIIGVGVLGIPILAGSAAYAMAETFGFTEGLNKPFHRAKTFYGVIGAATLLGFALNLLGLNPIRYLLYAAVLNGLVAPILIGVILLVANNKKIMGTHTNNWLSNSLAIISLILMSGAALAMMFIH